MQTLAVFDDFSKGHYGDDPTLGRGYFGGENFYVLPQGRALRIREGSTAISNTGISNGTSFMLIPKGGQDAVITVGTSAWGVVRGGGAPTAYGAVYAVSPTSSTNGWCWYGGGSLHSIYNDTIYYAAAATYAALGGPAPGGAHVAQLGDRIYTGGFPSLNNRLRYCDAAAPTSWPAGNIIDIGNSDDIITMIRRQRGSLLIVTTGNSSYSTRWWRLSGTPGADLRVDEIIPRGAYISLNDHQMYAAEGYGSRIWFNARTPDATTGWYGYVDADTPHLDVVRPLNSTLTAQSNASSTYLPASSPNFPQTMLHAGIYNGSAVVQRTVMLDDTRAIGQMTWDYSAATLNSSSEFQMIATGTTGFVIAAGGTGAAKPTLQGWRPTWDLDTAPDETDGSGAAVTGTVHTPVFEDDANRIIWPQAVQVDFRWYSSTTAMSCTVETSCLEENGATVLGPQSSTTQAFTVSGSPGTVGQRARKTFYTGDVIPGNVAQVKLSACRGITIERIKVLGEVVDPQT